MLGVYGGTPNSGQPRTNLELFTQNMIDYLTPAPVAAMASIVDTISCNGGNSASATATITGGISPITYSWSNGQTSDTATALSAGVYYVTVTDGFGTTATDSVIITEPTAITATVVQTQQTSRSGTANGALDLTVTGGTAGYTFLWSNGQMVKPSKTQRVYQQEPTS